jgi:hypothetical protein
MDRILMAAIHLVLGILSVGTIYLVARIAGVTKSMFELLRLRIERLEDDTDDDPSTDRLEHGDISRSIDSSIDSSDKDKFDLEGHV